MHIVVLSWEWCCNERADALSSLRVSRWNKSSVWCLEAWWQNEKGQNQCSLFTFLSIRVLNHANSVNDRFEEKNRRQWRWNYRPDAFGNIAKSHIHERIHSTFLVGPTSVLRTFRGSTSLKRCSSLIPHFAEWLIIDSSSAISLLFARCIYAVFSLMQELVRKEQRRFLARRTHVQALRHMHSWSPVPAYYFV